MLAVSNRCAKAGVYESVDGLFSKRPKPLGLRLKICVYLTITSSVFNIDIGLPYTAFAVQCLK